MQEAAQDWGDRVGLETQKALVAHFADIFRSTHVRIESVRDEGELLVLQALSGDWDGSRDFALRSSGEIYW
jgi:hypothetical protein